MVTGGRGVRNRYGNVAGHLRMVPGSRQCPDAEHQFDGKLTFDKLTDVYNSGTAHDEDQPVHLVVLEPGICHPRCTKEYGNPCQNFCPAAVYEMSAGTPSDQRVQLRPLQDLRHHGSVSDHQLDSAGRWRRSLVRFVVAGKVSGVFKVDLSLTYEK